MEPTQRKQDLDAIQKRYSISSAPKKGALWAYGFRIRHLFDSDLEISKNLFGKLDDHTIHPSTLRWFSDKQIRAVKEDLDRTPSNALHRFEEAIQKRASIPNPTVIPTFDEVCTKNTEEISDLFGSHAVREHLLRATDGDGNHLMHMACRENNKALLDEILLFGVSYAHDKNHNGDTPLHIAFQYGSKECIESILLRYPEGQLDENNAKQQPIEVACIHGQMEVMQKQLAERKDGESMAPKLILHAMRHAQIAELEWLFDTYSKEVSRTDNDKNTWLHMACKEALDTSVIELLARKFPLMMHAPNARNETPIQLACQYCKDADVLSSLLDERSKDIKDRYREDTLLHLACRNPNGADLVQRLCEHAPDLINKRNADGLLPIEVACGIPPYQLNVKRLTEPGVAIQEDLLRKRRAAPPNGENLARLIQQSAQAPEELLHKAYEVEHNEATIAVLAEKLPKEALERKNEKGQTPLHIACYLSNNLAAVRALLDGGADLEACDISGQSPFLFACRGRRTYDVIQFLLKEHPSFINHVDNEGDTALHLALRASENKETVTFLAAEKPELLQTKNKAGKTPWETAGPAARYQYRFIEPKKPS